MESYYSCNGPKEMLHELDPETEGLCNRGCNSRFRFVSKVKQYFSSDSRYCLENA